MRARGFTLTELAIVVMIVGFLIGGLLVPLTTQMEVRRIAETQRTMEMARDALLGFAASNGRLPCPAAPAPPGLGAGVEAVTAGACDNPYNGFLPAATLGIAPTDGQGYALDAWGNRIQYALTSNTALIGGVQYVFNTANGMRTASMPSIVAAPANRFISVCNSATGITFNTCPPANTLATQVPALMFSSGKNRATPPTGIDEQANQKLPPYDATYQVFVTHEPAPAGAANGEFDDVVVYLSLNQLFNRMIMGGALP